MLNQKFNIVWGEYEPLSTTRQWDGRRKLNRDFSLEVEGVVYTVDEGFLTDFSSYPFFSRILVRFDRVDVAGVIHDWIYFHGLTTRAKADQIWREVAMTGHHHANPFQAWLSWIGLRLGGWVAWNRHKRRRESMENQG